MPKSDTCKTCDMFHIKLSEPTTSEEEKPNLQNEKELRLRRADVMQAKLIEYTTEAKMHPDRLHTITIDLQQTLPTPKLTCGPSFYLRKLWTYNVGIYDCGNIKVTC